MKKIKFLMLAIVLSMVSCNTLSDHIKKRHGSYDKKISNADSLSNLYGVEYNRVIKKNPVLAKYAKRENLDNKFVIADNYVKNLRIEMKELDSIVDDNDGLNEAVLKKRLNIVDIALVKMKKEYEFPYNRSVFLLDVNKNVEKYRKAVDRDIGTIRKNYSNLVVVSDAYKLKYPKKEKEISKDMAKIKSVYDTDSLTFASFNTQYDHKIAKRDTVFDLIVLANNYALLKSHSSWFKKREKSYKSTLGELDDSYTKILMDVDAKYYVQIGRSSWDSYSDYDEGNKLYGFREVDEAAMEYFDGLPGNKTLAKYNRGMSINVNSENWKKLKISGKESWPRSHDEAEFWLNNVKTVYYHKYKIERNGKVTKTGFKKVSEDLFYDNLNNIGMAIESKPIGSFKHDATKVASPAGLSYVGNKDYGSWKTDTSGKKQWDFYPQWGFYNSVYGNSFYTYAMYTDYHSGYHVRRAYYGGTRYGTNGTVRPRGASSTNYSRKFASNNKSSINRSSVRQQASVRSGRSHRGGGPGGGGK